MIHIHATQGFIKDYLNGDNYENKDHYILNMSYVTWDDEEMLIMGALGEMKKETFIDLYSQLKGKGIKRIFACFPTDWVAQGFESVVGTNLHKREL